MKPQCASVMNEVISTNGQISYLDEIHAYHSVNRIFPAKRLVFSEDFIYITQGTIYVIWNEKLILNPTNVDKYAINWWKSVFTFKMMDCISVKLDKNQENVYLILMHMDHKGVLHIIVLPII